LSGVAARQRTTAVRAPAASKASSARDAGFSKDTAGGGIRLVCFFAVGRVNRGFPDRAGFNRSFAVFQ
jgi:hypothetical protein